MTYDKAFEIGSVIEGTVSKTYAEIFTEDGTKLFSIQRGDTTISKEVQPLSIELDRLGGIGRNVAIAFENPLGVPVKIDIDIPMVTTSYKLKKNHASRNLSIKPKQGDFETHVAVQLTKEGREVIIDACKNVGVYKYILWKTWKYKTVVYKIYLQGDVVKLGHFFTTNFGGNGLFMMQNPEIVQGFNDLVIKDFGQKVQFNSKQDESGVLKTITVGRPGMEGSFYYMCKQEPNTDKESDRLQDSYDPFDVDDMNGSTAWRNKNHINYTYYQTYEMVLKPHYVKLLEVLETLGTVYVRKDAFNWQPTNTNASTVTNDEGVEIRLDDALEYAKKKVENAKAILAMAATTIII